MSTTNTLHGQMSMVDDNGNVIVLHQETSASDVLVDNRNNKGENGGSAIPEGVDDLQKLANLLGKLAFKSKVDSKDFNIGIITDDLTIDESGRILDARAGKYLNTRLSNIENADVLVIGDEDEYTDFAAPVSEIDDRHISPTLTWSSKKIDDAIRTITGESVEQIFYIPLLEAEDGGYTTEKTLEDIEDAYNGGKAIWVVASDILLPLRKRVDEKTWIFSGYVDSQAYDIRISETGIELIYTNIVTNINPLTLKTGTDTIVYDGSEEIEIELSGAGVDESLLSDIELLKQRVEFLYGGVEFKFSTTSISPNKTLKGTIVTSITLSWKTTKTPVKVVLTDNIRDTEDEILSNPTTSMNKTISGLNVSCTDSPQPKWTITATDDLNKQITKSFTIPFGNMVYYGTLVNGTEITEDIIKGLEKSELLTSRVCQIKDIDAGGSAENKNVIYAAPTSFGTPTFTYGTTPGGFVLLTKIKIKNSADYEEEYTVYQSENVGLGVFTSSSPIKVS